VAGKIFTAHVAHLLKVCNTQNNGLKVSSIDQAFLKAALEIIFELNFTPLASPSLLQKFSHCNRPHVGESIIQSILLRQVKDTVHGQSADQSSSLLEFFHRVLGPLWHGGDGDIPRLDLIETIVADLELPACSSS
jgi:hypothetical protein